MYILNALKINKNVTFQVSIFYFIKTDPAMNCSGSDRQLPRSLIRRHHRSIQKLSRVPEHNKNITYQKEKQTQESEKLRLAYKCIVLKHIKNEPRIYV